MTDTIKIILAFAFIGLIVKLLYVLFNSLIFPWIINKFTQDIEVNPKWITSKTVNYYGFSDIDFVIVNSPLGATPRFRTVLKNNTSRLQLLLDQTTSTTDVDEIMRIALIGKILSKYGILLSNRSLNRLSILCYVLDNKYAILQENNLLDCIVNDDKDKKSVDLL